MNLLKEKERGKKMATLNNSKARVGKNLKFAVNSSDNIEQVIEKLAQPQVKRKSRAMQVVSYKLYKTGKPVMTRLGLYNPIKLNISADTLNKLGKGE